MKTKKNQVVGYARVITNEEGKIILVKEWYNHDPKLDMAIRDVGFEDWIDESEYKDSEVLITYSFWSDKYWTDCGYEYDSGLEIVHEILLGNNCKQKLKSEIEELYKEIQSFEPENVVSYIIFEDQEEAFTYLNALLGEYVECYEEEPFDEDLMIKIQNKI